MVSAEDVFYLCQAAMPADAFDAASAAAMGRYVDNSHVLFRNLCGRSVVLWTASALVPLSDVQRREAGRGGGAEGSDGWGGGAEGVRQLPQAELAAALVPARSNGSAGTRVATVAGTRAVPSGGHYLLHGPRGTVHCVTYAGEEAGCAAARAVIHMGYHSESHVAYADGTGEDQ